MGLMISFKNDKDNTTGLVTQLNDLRFSVQLRDDDCGEIMPFAKIFKEESDAIAYAKEICNQSKSKSLISVVI